MHQVKVFNNKIFAGYLKFIFDNQYIFEYEDDYKGAPISLTMPITKKKYEFNNFPPFFDGLLPEGMQLEGLLKIAKLDRDDYMGQLLQVGRDLVGSITIEPE